MSASNPNQIRSIAVCECTQCPLTCASLLRRFDDDSSLVSCVTDAVPFASMRGLASVWGPLSLKVSNALQGTILAVTIDRGSFTQPSKYKTVFHSPDTVHEQAECPRQQHKLETVNSLRSSVGWV